MTITTAAPTSRLHSWRLVSVRRTAPAIRQPIYVKPAPTAHLIPSPDTPSRHGLTEPLPSKRCPGSATYWNSCVWFAGPRGLNSVRLLAAKVLALSHRHGDRLPGTRKRAGGHRNGHRLASGDALRLSQNPTFRLETRHTLPELPAQLVESV
jgi:hypothetical protein